MTDTEQRLRDRLDKAWHLLLAKKGETKYMSFAEIGEELGITKREARDIHDRAIKKIKRLTNRSKKEAIELLITPEHEPDNAELDAVLQELEAMGVWDEEWK